MPGATAQDGIAAGSKETSPIEHHRGKRDTDPVVTVGT